jgi:hypothetical protein
MNNAVEMTPGNMIYIPLFIKIGSGVLKFLGGINTQTHTENEVIS